MNVQYGVIFVTTPDKAVADKIAQGLVTAKLAACVNIVPNITSVYRWKDKMEKTEENLLVIKSRLGLAPEIVAFVKANHPHEIPEVIALPVFSGNTAYLNWLGANTNIVPGILTLAEG